jgi:hypothetical protein
MLSGLLSAWFWRFANRLIPCRALVCMALEDVDAHHLTLPEGFRSRVAGSGELAAHMQRLARTERRSDECYAVFDGERLASFGPYSLRPTVIDGYPVYLDDGLAYLHPGFTQPRYSGLLLHAIAIGRALREYQRRVVRMIISDAQRWSPVWAAWDRPAQNVMGQQTVAVG